MRRSFRIMVSVALVAAVSGVGSVAIAQPPDPFIGHWQATDIDESDLSLSISGGPPISMLDKGFLKTATRTQP